MKSRVAPSVLSVAAAATAAWLAHPVVAFPLSARASGAADVTLDVSAQPSRQSQFGLGLFLETNINTGSDQGLYAELVYNRAFQVPDPPSNSPQLGQGSLKAWSAIGDGTQLRLTTQDALSAALPKSVVVSNSKASSGGGNGSSTGTGGGGGSGRGGCGIANAGFGGIPVVAEPHQLSFWARAASGAAHPTQLRVGLRSSDRATTYAEATVDAGGLDGEWRQLNATLTPSRAAGGVDNVLTIEAVAAGGAGGGAGVCGEGGLQLNLVSLMPPTWEGTVARRDLAQALADTKPVYFRLPGGNDLEGNAMQAAFNWSNAVGPLRDRPGRAGTWTGWNTEGMGLLELMDLAEKLGAEPILGVYAGYSLDGSAAPEGDSLQRYVASALDQLHFLLDESGAMADRRASHGRARPYSLRHVEIGNEDWLGKAKPSWTYRYPAFRDAIRREFPQLDLIASSPYGFTGQQGIDQHDYNNPEYFFSQYDRMDSWPRNGTLIWELEYAVIDSGLCAEAHDIYSFGPCRLRKPTLVGALSEAAFLLGAERNGDLCRSAAYAPLFDNEAAANATQWTPDLVSFDASRSVRSASYHVQRAFGETRVADVYGVGASSPPKQSRVFHSVGATAASAAGAGAPRRLVVRLVNADEAAPKRVDVKLGPLQPRQQQQQRSAQVWQLNGTDAQASNTLDSPDVVAPRTFALPEGALDEGARTLSLELPPLSFTIVTIDA